MSEASTIRRREFIAGTTAVAAGAALSSEALASGKSSLYNLTPADFEKLIGQTFQVNGTSEKGTQQRGNLVLKKVVPADTAKDPSRPASVRAEGFSLRFSSNDLALVSGTHDVSGGGFGSHAVHLQEMLDQREPGERHYEAVFN